LGKKTKNTGNTKRKRQGNVKIVVSPVYIGDQPMKEVLGNAMADQLKYSALDKVG